MATFDGGTREHKDRAAEAAAKGRWKQALEHYAAVERVEPNDGLWPHKIGEAWRRLGDKGQAMAAFTRAANAYSRGGFLLKAIAVNKMILELDPDHTETQKRLAALHSARTVPARPTADYLPPSSRPSAPAPSGSSGVVSLGELVPGARPWPAAEGAAAAVVEIPVEVEVELEAVPPPAAAPSAEETLRSVLPRTPLFSALEERHLARLIDRVRLVVLDPDQVLFRQGDPGDALYVVAAGELAALVRAAAGAELVEVSRLGEGTFFGEIALLADQPRSATVRAAQPTQLLAIDRDAVRELVADSPEAGRVLVRFIRDRLLNSMVETSRLFARLSPRETVSIAARFRFLEVEKGAILLREGKDSPGFLLVLAGNVAVTEGDRTVAALGPGDVIGERPLLDKAPSRATVRATTKSFLLGLTPADFVELVGSNPRFHEAVLELGAERERRS